MRTGRRGPRKALQEPEEAGMYICVRASASRSPCSVSIARAESGRDIVPEPADGYTSYNLVYMNTSRETVST